MENQAPAHKSNSASARVLLLRTNRSYRAQPFLEAAAKLGVEVVQAIDMPGQLAEYYDVSLGLEFAETDLAAQRIVSYATERPLNAIIAVDDSGAVLAAKASDALGLPHNSVEAAEAARDKLLMRRLLSQADLLVPHFQSFSTADDLNETAGEVQYPCVVKPLRLSGSRGVIRADNRNEFVSAVSRLDRILEKLAPGPHAYLVEEFIPGYEVALEGILDDGLKILALFDKPDPLDGPFFEETIYVTPSRLPLAIQSAIAETTAAAADAIGLRTGPIHAELRINERGPWIVEIAGRSIGGLCSQTLRFGSEATLEELIIRQACGMAISSSRTEEQAGGVMMIPIPKAGLLKSIGGIDEASALALIDGVEITARLNYPLQPLPEGASYLGFIFASGPGPAEVEEALRQAHNKLTFEISPMIPLLNVIERP